MSKNNHRVALAILDHDRTTSTLDKDRLIWWLARTHPGVFVQGVREQDPKTFVLQVASCVDQDHLRCIKALREAIPGLSLKDAKEHVDALRSGGGPVKFSVQANRVLELSAKLDGVFRFEFI